MSQAMSWQAASSSHCIAYLQTMGALLSIPFFAVPSITGVGGWVLSCCGAAACTSLCKPCGTCTSSIATRIAYAVLFLFNSIISWIMLSPFALKKLEHLTMDYMHITCPEGECYGVLAVHRINWALGMLHLILAAFLIGVRSTRNRRASIQNGWWGPKIMAWAVLVVLSFLIPNQFFVIWGNYIAMTGSVLFILYGLILLIDAAHSWAETCLEKYEATESRGWEILLVGSTFGMYAGALAMIIVSYIFFAGSGCGLNQTFISLNVVLAVIVTAMAVHPTIQEYNSRSGLAQSAMVCIYATYLTLSAICNEPDNPQCNPLSKARGSRTMMVILGAMFTFLAIAYSTTRAATQGSSIGTNQSGTIRLDTEQGEDHGLITNEPSERRRMRAEALRAAVDAGSLPASALEESDDEDSIHQGSGSTDPADRDDERGSVQYQYSTFHFVFFLATCYTACLLTSWNTMKTEEGKDDETLILIGRSMTVVWVKIVSSWVVYLLYGWSLILPVVTENSY